ncbi:MAG: phosphonate ABC transporter ATP-binding protein [Lautropia sp.]
MRLGGRDALDAVSIALASGEQVALIGPSGAGKTTLLAVLAAALRPTTGRVLIDGADPWSLPPGRLRALRSRLFLAPQTPPLPPRQRVVTSVLAGRVPQWSIARALASLWHPRETALARDALATFSLEDRLWSRVDRLSGGERQRVALARMRVSGARLLLVDEPLSALDPTLAEQTMAALTSLARAEGATLVCSLHQVDLALKWFPRIFGLREGRCYFDLQRDAVDAGLIDDLYRGDPSAFAPVPSDGDAIDLPLVRVGACR